MPGRASDTNASKFDILTVRLRSSRSASSATTPACAERPGPNAKLHKNMSAEASPRIKAVNGGEGSLGPWRASVQCHWSDEQTSVHARQGTDTTSAIAHDGGLEVTAVAERLSSARGDKAPAMSAG